MGIPGVVGTAVGRLPSGEIGVQVLVTNSNVRGLPAVLDGIPVAVRVSGLLMAWTDPTTRARPAPLGFSVGHPDITAGTIGARVVDGSGSVYLLSNNHVLANSNNANIGDPTLQPGPFDGGTLADQIATLADFEPIDFRRNGRNQFDAAIALSNTAVLDNSTPLDDGYGLPSATIYGDANGDGLFDNRNALLGLSVQKYGRTTGRTVGQITGVNATLSICYEAFIFCTKAATFVDQFVIEPGGFSGGGDSGSLIVTNDGNRNPVALLFAGSSTQTIASRIDLVLDHFGVSIDAEPSGPPTPTTDIAITNVNAPAFVTEGESVPVVVTVTNVGNQDVTSSFDVTLLDETDNIPFDPQSVDGLAAGASVSLTFSWTTNGSSPGSHTLTASHDLVDDNGANNLYSANVTVNLPGTGIHVGNLDAITSNEGKTWSAVVEVVVHDANHNPINGAAVTGVWDPAAFGSDECTTGDLGGNGSCIFLNTLIRKNVSSVTFTVTSVVALGQQYAAGENHDPDSSSNGTVIVVAKP